ncbi:ferrochelatase [uncultured Proteiniphilum sp.]|uniref:ferrochelatase n=1 Tax=uncultured Proteiniphilum sp. TaxID=497637 RepID=UPI002635AC75|nr:ferrochelatase [uncultured Proteiniphilum sp.]
MKGILLINVGTPASTEKNDVKEFIGAMLSDPFLTGKPEWWSTFLAKNIIAPSSASRVSEKYKLIWHNEETPVSPLVYHMRKLAQKLEEQKGLPVEIAMRYGEPDITSAFRELEKKCPLLHELIVFPLYPHYAQSTTQTSKEMTGNIFYRHPHSFRLKFAEPFYNHPAFIHALTSHAKPYLEDIDKLVFTYHSLPLPQVEAGWKKGKEYDYVYQLKETNRLFCEKLDIDPHDTFLFYSSQRGKNWLNPFLNTDIGDLPKLGWKKVAVIAPGFPVDNMETLYDIDIEARKIFMEAGGEKLTFIPSLNSNDFWVEAIWKIIERT